MKKARAHTISRIDACHAEIARLIEMERVYLERVDPSANDLWCGVRGAGLEILSWSPQQRANMQVGAASLTSSHAIPPGYKQDYDYE